MAASLVMASVKGRLPLLAESFGVAETLTELNRSLVDELGRREFVALCYVRYSPATGEIELANAGLPDPYALAEGESPRALSAPGPRLPLGAARNIVYETVTARIEPGERLFLFTDGLPEALLPDGSPLGYPGFEKMLGWRDRPLESWLEALFGELESTVGSHRDDDWTALLLERSAEPVMGLED